MKNNFDLICIDLQNDFASFGGKNHNKGKSVEFIKEKLFPLLLKKEIQVNEIVSDYRLPRGKSKNESCAPGTWGFESILPSELRKGNSWIKCMHNPIWIRKNIGKQGDEMGNPYQSPKRFNKWIKEHLATKNIILFGLTTECCVLQVASELYFRGYNVYCIYEATDPMNERLEYKDTIINSSTFSLYAKCIKFNEFLKLVEE